MQWAIYASKRHSIMFSRTLYIELLQCIWATSAKPLGFMRIFPIAHHKVLNAMKASINYHIVIAHWKPNFPRHTKGGAKQKKKLKSNMIDEYFQQNYCFFINYIYEFGWSKAYQ
mgnify:FL=1